MNETVKITKRKKKNIINVNQTNSKREEKKGEK